MSRRYAGVLALIVVAHLAPFGAAKSPELPESLLVIAQPLVYLPVDFVPAPPMPKPCDLDRLRKNPPSEPKPRTILENLDHLMDAGEILAQAKKHMVAGELSAAFAKIELVRKLVPGSTLAAECDFLVRRLAARVRAVPTPLETDDTLSVVAETTSRYLRRAESFCRNFDTTQAKKVMAEAFLKAANQAMSQGRTNKAVDLIRQAHALVPEVVEADPMVYKLHLLDTTRPRRSGEEAAEPSRVLPMHPRQYPPLHGIREMGRKAYESETFQITVGLLGARLMESRIPNTADVLKGHNGIVMEGMSCFGRPTLTLVTRCSNVKGHLMIRLEMGSMPIVWMMPVR